MSDMQVQQDGRIGRLFNLAFDAMSSSTSWVTDKADEYVRLLWKGLGWSALALLGIAAIYAIGVAFKSTVLLAASILLFGVVFVALMVITSPILTGVAALAQTFASARVVVQAMGAVALFFILVALAFLYIPITPATAVVVPLAALALGMLWVATGNKQSLSMLATRVSMVLVVTLLGTTLNAMAPESAQRLRTLGGSLDRSLARSIGAVSVTADSGSRVRIESLEQFHKTIFFHPGTREPQLWYALASDGSLELFNARGFHPTTGEPLQPVGPDVVARLRARLERDAKFQRSQQQPAPGTAATTPVVSHALAEPAPVKIVATPSDKVVQGATQPVPVLSKPPDVVAAPTTRSVPTAPTQPEPRTVPPHGASPAPTTVAPPVPAGPPPTIMTRTTDATSNTGRAQPQVQTVMAAPPAGRDPAPASPREACGSRVFIALNRCMDKQCETAQFRTHPQCVRWAQEAQYQRNRADNQ